MTDLEAFAKFMTLPREIIEPWIVPGWKYREFFQTEGAIRTFIVAWSKVVGFDQFGDPNVPKSVV
jgi:hypothetical protein